MGVHESLDLQAMAQAELSRTGVRLAFPPALEARYTNDTGTERARELRAITRLGTLFYVAAGVGLKILLADPVSWWIAGAHLGGVTTANLVLSQRYMRPTSPGRAREAAILACCLSAALATILSLTIGAQDLRLQGSVVAILPVNFILVFVPLRFPAAVVLLAVTFGVFVSTLAYDHLAGSAALFPIGIMAALCLPALVGVHARERATRRLYLHGLLQSLRSERLAKENIVLSDLTLTDPLTGAANRRRLDAELTAFCASPRAGGALLLIDVDRFKDFNDRFGHLAGDECLRQIAARLSMSLRPWDLLARFGGEEFAVLLPTAGAEEAAQTAERLRHAVDAQPVCIDGRSIDVTVSLGLAIRDRGSDARALIGAADRALYAAKAAGRNQVKAAAGAVA
jgi:diguanylate cyclase (GGDEF)-like protein